MLSAEEIFTIESRLNQDFAFSRLPIVSVLRLVLSASCSCVKDELLRKAFKFAATVFSKSDFRCSKIAESVLILWFIDEIL